MIFDPQYILDQKIISGGDIAQNGIDCHLNSLEMIVNGGSVIKDKARCDKPGLVPLTPNSHNSLGVPAYYLKQGKAYQFECAETVKLPAGMCAMVLPRSSLIRRGVLLGTGLYDSGYEGHLGGCLYASADTLLEDGVAILQMVFVKSEGTRLYEGQYQEKGAHIPITGPKLGDDSLRTAARPEDLQALAKGEGVKFDSGKARYDLIDPFMLEAMAQVLAHGAVKYGPDNWKYGLTTSRLFASAMRHAWAFYRGENLDHDSAMDLCAQVMTNMMMIGWIRKNRPDRDDRGKMFDVFMSNVMEQFDQTQKAADAAEDTLKELK
jgi:deoxycytidine triphosphate deaminase